MDEEKVPVIGSDPREETPDEETRPSDSRTSENMSVKEVLNQIRGVKLQFGKYIFQVNYINEGKQRFSAEYIEDAEESNPK